MLLTLLVSSSAIVAAAGGARAYLGGGPSAATPTASAAPPPRPHPGPQEGRRNQVEAELITAGPDGFQPAEITRPKGRFYLVVDNMSELSVLDLRLAREAGNGVREVRIPRGQADWTELLDLAPGTYVLREAAHPGWACRIIVNP